MTLADALSRDELISLYREASAKVSSLEETLASKTAVINSQTEILSSQENRIDDLSRQLAWFRRQLFGKKSEKLLSSHPEQLFLGDYTPGEAPPAPTVTVKAYEKAKRHSQIQFVASESRLKFDSTVPVIEKEVNNPALNGLSIEDYEVIGEEVTYRLSQRRGAYEVIKYRRKKVKIKETSKIITAPLSAPAAVIEKSIAEVSFLAGLTIDKFQFHLPLFRQHQRLQASGVYINRMTLTNLVHRTAELLEPVYRSVQSSILSGKVISVDELPLKAGRDKNKHQMKKGYLWGIYGDRDEIAFLFSASRSGKLVREVLQQYEGVLLSDGYTVYERFTAAVERIIHAQCWSHARRKFFDIREGHPECDIVLSLIGELYRIEEEYGTAGRDEYSRAIVDYLFTWLKKAFETEALLPSDAFTGAATYALKRETALRVFLDNPDVPLDTNHLERENRRIVTGRKNWLFNFTEVGAERAAVLQSLIACCVLQNVDPYTYFVDVLQRIESHPMSEIHLLTPRLWKEHFAENPLREELYSGNHASG